MDRKKLYRTSASVWLPLSLRRIDTYFARSYIKSFCIIMLALAVLVVISDIFQNFDDFMVLGQREELEMTDVFRLMLLYYGTFMPQLIFQYMFPVAMLLAAAVTATAAYSGAKGNNEYIVIRSAGIPVLRAFLPFLLGAFFISVLFQCTRDVFLPWMTRQGQYIYNRLKSRQGIPLSLSLMTEQGCQVATMGDFGSDAVAHNIIIELRDTEAFQRGDPALGDNNFTAWRAAAARLAPDDNGQWAWYPLEKAKMQKFTQYSRTETEWSEPVATEMMPAMIERQVLGDSVSTWKELFVLRSNSPGARYELYYRIADPVACVILVLWGTCLCMGLMLRGRSASFVASIAVAMLVAGCFYVLRLIGGSLWESGILPPGPAVWLPIAVGAVCSCLSACWMER